VLIKAALQFKEGWLKAHPRFNRTCSRKLAEPLHFFQKGNVGLVLGTIRRAFGREQLNSRKTFHRRPVFRMTDDRRLFSLVETRHAGQTQMELQDAPSEGVTN